MLLSFWLLSLEGILPFTRASLFSISKKPRHPDRSASLSYREAVLDPEVCLLSTCPKLFLAFSAQKSHVKPQNHLTN
jgi:hypothetical protein